MRMEMEKSAGSYIRFLEGDDDALCEIVEEYKDGLILYINGFVRDIYASEDLMIDTFYKLITKKPRIREDGRFKMWLYTVARNTALDYLRRRKHDAVRLDESAEEKLDDGLDLERSYINGERKSAVSEAMKKLSPDYSQILWLLYFEDFSPADAAKIMKKSMRQIRNLTYRAKQSLKNELLKEGFEYEDM